MKPNLFDQLKLNLQNIPAANKELFKRYFDLKNKIVSEGGEEAKSKIEASAKAICGIETPTRQEKKATIAKRDAATSPIRVF